MAEECPKCEAGLPAWLATFADLMSLLMCFFVLLLSFATIDAVRFKKMAESMKDAFGVQREIPANEIVKGVSVIKQEFSTGKPEPTVIDEIRQITTDEEQENLEINVGS
ncbi:flagellar motor protein MotB, partial [endosymbiont of Ridgeia piscesae]